MACIYSRSILHRIHSRKETENVVPRGIECKRDIVRGYTYIFTMGQKVQDVPVTILWCVRVSFSCSDKTLNMNQQCYSEKCFFCFVFKNIASELEVSSDCSPTPLFPSVFFCFFFKDAFPVSSGDGLVSVESFNRKCHHVLHLHSRRVRGLSVLGN